MSASAEMPYFIRPSRPLADAEKRRAYEDALAQIAASLQGEKNAVLKMATINCLLKTHLPYFYWVGFYIMHQGRLMIGPYQGTLGCLYIEPGRGVCGKAVIQRQTQIVADVHALAQGTDHIACDPNSASEIVVPVFDHHQQLRAVLDVDSTLPGSFDATDRHYLEEMVDAHFAKAALSGWPVG